MLVFWAAIGTAAGLGCVYVCGGGQEFTEHSILFLSCCSHVCRIAWVTRVTNARSQSLRKSSKFSYLNNACAVDNCYCVL